jgi:Arc/MetJ family transcription regulator
MATNLGIDEKLLEEAVHVGKQRTKKATVNEALREYIDRRKRLKVVELFGKVDFDPQYDYKAERRKR